jgi:hypothetical protein
MTLSADMEERCQRVANKERCKHGMVFEYCAHCQVYEIPREYKVPIDIIDDETGDDKTIFMSGVTIDKYYYKYRKSNPDIKHKRKTTKPHSLGYKVHTVDSAITRPKF